MLLGGCCWLVGCGVRALQSTLCPMWGGTRAMHATSHASRCCLLGCWVLLDAAGCCWVLLGAGCLVGSPGCCLLGGAGGCWVLPGGGALGGCCWLVGCGVRALQSTLCPMWGRTHAMHATSHAPRCCLLGCWVLLGGAACLPGGVWGACAAIHALSQCGAGRVRCMPRPMPLGAARCGWCWMLLGAAGCCWVLLVLLGAAVSGRGHCDLELALEEVEDSWHKY